MIRLAQALIVTAVLLGAAFLEPRDAALTFRVASVMPFPATITVCVPTNGACDPQSISLNPGQTKTFDWESDGDLIGSYEVAVHAEGSVVDAIYGGPISFRGETARVVGEQTVLFHSLQASGQDEIDLTLAAPDPDDESLLLSPLANSLDEAQANARELASILPLRLEFVTAFENRPMPILLGASFADSNTSFGPGVEVSESLAETPLGSPVTLRHGDVLLRINGSPVYGASDVFRLLVEHAHRRSVGEPFTFEVERDGRRYVAWSGAYFSDAFYPPSDNDATKTFWRAVGRSLTLGTGLDRHLLCAGEIPSDGLMFGHDCLTVERNRQLLLSQQHAIADLAGSLITVPVPLLRIPFRGLFPGTRIGRAAAIVLADTVEASILAGNEAPPAVDRTTRMAAAIPLGAGAGVLLTLAR